MHHKILFRLIWLAAISFVSLDAVQAQNKDAKQQISEFVNGVGYGVPSTPAFEILPDKPSEVVHLLTPNDFQTTIKSIFAGSRFRPGFAFDVRPLSRFAGSLERYNKNFISRVAWRTVLALGSAADPNDPADALVSVGMRIPLIDKADPRTRLDHINRLEQAYEEVFGKQPNFDESRVDFEARIAPARRRADSLRQNFEKSNWNAFKVDLGFAEMWRAKNNRFNGNSLGHERFGVWSAAGFPLSKQGQLTMSAKLSWRETSPFNQESARHVAGGRARFFWKTAAFSVEGAQVWSKNKSGATSLNDAWLHFAAVTEFKIPVLNSWIAIAYGGDTGRRAGAKRKISLSYAYYKNRLIPKK